MRVVLLGAAPPGVRSGTVNALEHTAVQLQRIGVDVVRMVDDPTTGQGLETRRRRVAAAQAALVRFQPHVVLVETVDAVVMGSHHRGGTG